MKLAINIGCILGRYGLEGSAAAAKRAGFDSMDYPLDAMVDPKNIFNQEDLYVGEAERIGKVAREGGVPITQTHTPFVFRGWNDPTTYEEFIIPAIKRSVKVSAIMGADVAVVHPLHHFVYRGHEEEIFERNMEFYRSLIPICKEYNIRVGIENMYQVDQRRKHIVHDTCSRKEEFVRYIDTLDSEYMVACLDTGHIGLPLQDDEPWDVIRALGHDRLHALHVHDNDYKSDSHKLPYMGTINWNEVTKALGEIDYDGVFTYESGILTGTMDEEIAPVALKYMADIGRHLCNLTNRSRPAKK